MSESSVSPGKKHLRAALLLMLVISVASLLAGEGLVRWISPQNLSGTWFVPAERPYLMNKAGGTARHQSGTRVVRYHFNADHMRGGPVNMAADLKVLCLGDSFTFGWLVEEGDHFVGLLQSRAAEAFAPASVEFMNGSAGGWGAAHYLAFFEDHGERLRPDAIVVFLNMFDVRRSMAAGLFQLRKDGELDVLASGDVAGTGRMRELAQSIPGYEWLLEHSHLFQLARRACMAPPMIHGNPRHESSEDAEEGVRLAQALFRRLNGHCQRRGTPLLVISIGAGSLISQKSPGEWSMADRKFSSEASTFFASISVPFIDLAGPMAAAAGADAERYLIPVDRHFNEDGNALCAQAAWPWLREQLARVLSHGGRQKA